MTGVDSPMQNQLLAALPDNELALLRGHLERVPMLMGDMLYAPGEHLGHAYFPTSATVSLHYVTESGASCEICGVGRDGMVGIALFMGGQTVPSSAVVQASGYAYRLPRAALQQAFDRAGSVRGVLLRYAQELMTRTSQAAVCNRHHSILQALSRWLLSMLDRAPGGELILTQELIAHTLGVRREGITDAAGKLQAAGWIRYRRGQICVLDRAGLESQACECYEVVNKELARLRLEELGQPFAALSSAVRRPMLAGMPD